MLMCPAFFGTFILSRYQLRSLKFNSFHERLFAFRVLLFNFMLD
jgi:hypothetical protein